VALLAGTAFFTGAALVAAVTFRTVAVFVAATVFDALFRAALIRSAMASPTCKMGARRGAAHSSGPQGYGTYRPATNMPHEFTRFSGANVPWHDWSDRSGRATGPTGRTG
jgi:hypothetical protein